MSKCVEHHRKNQSRRVWIKHFGTPPNGLYVLHSCDNKFCINLKHLHLGTHYDNMREAHERRRFKTGERVKHSKLNNKKVKRIHALLSSGLSQQRIADMFGVSQKAISKVKNGDSWRKF